MNILEDVKHDKNASTIQLRNLSRSFAFFRYEGSIAYYYNKQNNYNYNLNLGYRKNFEYPSIDQLFTIVDEINLYNIQVGNPDLKTKINHTYDFNIHLNQSNPNAKYAYNATLNSYYVKSLNPVIDSIINDPSGVRTSYYINGVKSNAYNTNYNFNISRKIKKNNIQLMYNGSFNINKFPSYIDAIFSETKTSSINNNLTIQYSLRSLLVFNLGKRYNLYRTTQSAAGLTSFKNYSDATKLGVTLNYPKGVTVSTSISNTNNTSIKKPVVLWNAFASYRFLKNEQAEVKFSAMDMLKQYRNITNSANNYGTTVRVTNGLQQYFMLTLAYFPRKFGKTDIKKQEFIQEW